MDDPLTLRAKRGSARLSTVLTVLFVVGAVGAAGWFYVSVYPWVSGPDESAQSIDKRWNKLIEWAGPPGPKTGAGPDLSAALTAMDAAAKLQRPIEPDGDGTLPRLSLADQPEAAQQAIAGLVAWAKSRGGLARAGHPGPAYCLDRTRPLTILRLGRLALATADDDAGSAQVTAVLDLASVAYRQGMLIQMMIGLTLFREAAGWLNQRKLKPAPAFTALRPDSESVFPGLVRDAVCFYYQMESELSPSDPPPVDLPSVQSLFFSLERELLWVRKFHADRYQRALPKKNDLSALAQAMVLPAEDELPHSHLVRLAAAANLPDLIKRMADGLAEYDEILIQAEANPAVRREPQADAEEKPAGVAKLTAAADATGPLRDQTITIPAGLRDEILADLSVLSRSARLTPSIKDGRAEGFKITGIRPGSFYEVLQLRDGDVIREIAGMPLNTPERALQVYQMVDQAKLLKVALTRRGKDLTFTYRVTE